jgi:hypothetical protein
MKKNPLWTHVVLLERAGVGGNARWRCKYCKGEFGVNYSRVKSHLLLLKNIVSVSPYWCFCGNSIFAYLIRIISDTRTCIRAG